MIGAAPSSVSIPQAAATSPNPRCRVRSGMMAASRASSSAPISAAEPRYRSETSTGLPSAQPISRRYQYGLPLMIFLYRLAISPPASCMATLGHRIHPRSGQHDTPEGRRSDAIRSQLDQLKIDLSRKLRLAGQRFVMMVVTGSLNRRSA